jgi:4-amino-4-deoxy-L-arabinose transferase-like glycosyltransferase
VLLLAIVGIGFLIRLWLLDKRWINPDEGAHIMDGMLALEGLVPEVDFDSRQPIYTYTIALALKTFGMNYIAVRLLPLIATLGIILLIYLISKRLFNERVALLATAIYTFLPLSILESVIVKTEPLTTLLSCLGIFLVILGVECHERGRLFFFLSGLSLSLAFYVRESSLAILLAIFLIFVTTYRRQPHLIVKNYATVMGGYISLCLLVFAYFSQYMSPVQIWNSPMNPLGPISHAFQAVVGSFSPETTAPKIMGSTAKDYDSWAGTAYYLNLTLFTHAFLFVGLLFSIIISAYPVFLNKRRENNGQWSFPFPLLYSWIFSLALAYSYWMIHRGYFIQYFEEFLPPLTILLAFVINDTLPKLGLEKSMGKKIGLAAFLLFIVFFFNRKASYLDIKSILYVLVTILVLAYYYFSPVRPQRWLIVAVVISLMTVGLSEVSPLSPYSVKLLLNFILIALAYLTIFVAAGLKLQRDFKLGLGFVALSLLLSTSVLSFAASGRSMGIEFDSGWSPKTVKETSEYVRVNSERGDEIMSGGVIWELEAGRRPFMNITHPLKYIPGIPDDEASQIEWYSVNYPPKFIILDNYTEKTYLIHIKKIQVLMDEKYELKKAIAGSHKPVKIYELRDTWKRPVSNPANDTLRLL